MGNIPLDYRFLNIQQFIEVRAIELAHKDLVIGGKLLIKYFTGKDPDTIELKQLKKYQFRLGVFRNSYLELEKAKPQEVIWIKGKRYKGITDVSKLNNNQYTTVMSLIKDGKGDVNINKLAALIFYRYKFNTEAEFNDKLYDEISEVMLTVRVGKIFPTVFFYAKVLEKLTPYLESYLLASQKVIEKAIEEMTEETPGQDFKNNMIGTM